MRKFGHIHKNKCGSYKCYWQESDKQRTKTFPTREEAVDHLARMRLNNGSRDYSVTYSTYYNAVVKPTLKDFAARTKSDYRYYWNKMKPLIGNKKIAKTDWRLVQNTINAFETAESQRKVFNILRKILDYAVRDEILQSNPCTKQIQRKQIIRKQKKLWTKEEVVEMLEILDGTIYALPVLLECVCGLRHEEYCGINTTDIRFDNGWTLININKAVTNVGGKKVLKDTKTMSSERTVVLHKSFLDYVNSNINNLTYKHCLKDYTNPGVLTKNFRYYCRRNDLNFIPFGNMRSVYATLCAEAGCVDSIVSMSMGHAGDSVKQKNYQSMTLKALKLNATALSDYIDFDYTMQD